MFVYFSQDLCPFCLNGNSCFKRKSTILQHIYSECIYYMFITVVLSMSGFQFEATDLLNFVIVSSHCWTGFSGCLISYQCKDFNSVSQQIKCQGYTCSSPSAETMFCQKDLPAAYLYCWAPMNVCARPTDFQFTRSPFLPRNLYSCVGRGK